MATPVRRAIERRSAPLLLGLRRLPVWAPFLVVLALVLGGLFTPPTVGAGLLVVVALLVGWLTYLAWPVLSPSNRAIRIGVLVIVVVAAASRIAGS